MKTHDLSKPLRWFRLVLPYLRKKSLHVIISSCLEKEKIIRRLNLIISERVKVPRNTIHIILQIKIPCRGRNFHSRNLKLFKKVHFHNRINSDFFPIFSIKTGTRTKKIDFFNLLSVRNLIFC